MFRRPPQYTRIDTLFPDTTLFRSFKLIGRVEVVGAENVPANGAFVLAPVHRSNVDFALTSIVTKRPMRYVGKDSIWKSRLLGRSEEHTSELQSLMRISYAVFCLQKKQLNLSYKQS